MTIISGPITEAGPLVDVLISVGRIESGARKQRGIEIPQPISGKALIDTGASRSFIDTVPQQWAKDMMPTIREIGYAAIGSEAIFRTRQDAVFALSTAALTWARREAGLPPLP